jgi:hypothetical protein
MTDKVQDKALELRKAYARLVGLEEANSGVDLVEQPVVDDFERIRERVAALIGEQLEDLTARPLLYKGSSQYYARWTGVHSKVRQLRRLLELGYSVADDVVQVGSLYNSIKDDVLRSRCADLLTAQSNFDRVVNQATLVLEDRIRRRVRDTKALTGVQLVNEYLKVRPPDSTLVFSDDENEQRGTVDIIRGVMHSMRNETHHRLVERYDRNDALVVCSFIDRLLTQVDTAMVRT